MRAKVPGRGNPSWLVEGVADYVRFFKFEPGKLGKINPERAHYNQSYRVTAAFLAYLVEKYDPKFVLKLNLSMRAGTYKPELLQAAHGQERRRTGQRVARHAQETLSAARNQCRLSLRERTFAAFRSANQSFQATPQRGRSWCQPSNSRLW